MPNRPDTLLEAITAVVRGVGVRTGTPPTVYGAMCHEIREIFHSRRDIFESRLLEDFPNLQAILDGRVSGHYTEWPMIRVELRRLLEVQFATLEVLNGYFNGVLNASSWEECRNRVINELAPAVRAVAVQPASDECRNVLTELLRLYDWRRGVGNAITRKEAMQYGREKKVAWDVARKVLSALQSVSVVQVPIPAQCELLHCTRPAIKDGRCSVHAVAGQSITASDWKSWTESPPEVKEPTAYPVLVADDADSNKLTLMVAEWGPQLHRSGASNYGDVWRCTWSVSHVRNWLPVELRTPCERLIDASDSEVTKS